MESSIIRPLRGAVSRRWKANWPAYFEYSGHETSCVIVDISGCGAKVRTETLPEQGGAVRLIVDSIGAIDAEVAWRRDGAAGLRFKQVQRWVLNLQDACADPTEAHDGTKRILARAR